MKYLNPIYLIMDEYCIAYIEKHGTRIRVILLLQTGIRERK